MTDPDVIQAMFREFTRLGFRPEDLPGLAMETGAEHAFLERLRRLEPGATLHDVLPDLPAHWIVGQPETWTGLYRPLGPYDYQELPTGPAVHVDWPKAIDPNCLVALVTAARDAGWPIYGAGFLEETDNPAWPTLDAYIVLERGTSTEVLDEFLLWIEDQPDVRLATVDPRDDER